MIEHKLVYSHHYSLAERCFWRSHPSSGSRSMLSGLHEWLRAKTDEVIKVSKRFFAEAAFAVSHRNLVFRAQCSCGASGEIDNTPYGQRDLLVVWLNVPKAAKGHCPVVKAEIDREIVAAAEIADDNYLPNGEEQRLAEEGKAVLDAEHRAIEKRLAEEHS